MDATLQENQMAKAAVLSRAELIDLANEVSSVRNNEAAVTTVMRLWIAFGRLEHALQVSPVSRYRFEFPVSGGRIDLLLFHVDGGITIVEAKGEVPASLVAAGIGQLCLYKTLLAPVVDPLKPAYVNLILAAPIAPEDSGAMSMACEMAGVRLVPMPVFGEVNEQADLLRKKYGAQVFSDAGAVG